MSETVSIRWTDFENVEQTSNSFKLEVNCPDTDLVTIVGNPFTFDATTNDPTPATAVYEDVLATEDLWVTVNSDADACQPESHTIVLSSNNNDLGGTFLLVDADGKVTFNTDEVGTQTVKVKYTHALEEKYSNEFSVTVECPAQTDIDPSSESTLTQYIPDTYQAAKEDILDREKYATLSITNTGCVFDEFLLFNSDDDTEVSSTWLEIGATTGTVSVDINLRGQMTVYV